jgi:hypothetical protein
MRQHRTVTFLKLGARVRLAPEANHGEASGELIAIGRIFLSVRLDDGRVDKRVRPSWCRLSPAFC